MTYNKAEEELFCITRHMEQLKAKRTQVKDDSKEALVIEKDIQKCENIIKDMLNRL